MSDSSANITREELTDVLELICHQYGYNFKDYSLASIKRRILRCMELSHVKDAYGLKYLLVNDKEYFNWFVEAVTVNVTEMFRDPGFYREMRDKVFPKLASYPIIKIWMAGCSTGEEVYSMAIMLKEEGLLDRTRLYGTDINPLNIEKARKGMIALPNMKSYTQNYIQAGGKEDFSNYYTARYGNAIIRRELKKNILFSQHNLVTDHVFSEFQLICCRNVLIYFNHSLQNHVMHLFYDSLSPLGYLAIGTKESMLFTDLRDKFDVISLVNKIFRRKKATSISK